MVSLQQDNYTRSYLRKAEEYFASAEENYLAERYTVAAGDAIHAGICAKDAIVTALTGSTAKRKDHAVAGKELRQALGRRQDAAGAEKALRELISHKGDVEYGVALMSAAKTEPLVRRARSLVALAVRIVRLGE